MIPNGKCCGTTLMLLSILLPGCAPEELAGSVTGKITYKGKQLDKGAIAFYPNSSGQVCGSNIQPDGTFRLINQEKTDRIPIGNYTAVIIADNGNIAAMNEDPLMKIEPTVPFKFSSPGTSPLKYDVVVGENNFDINLDAITKK